MGQIQGIEIGLVIDVKDPLNQGRVRLHCPALGPKHETTWVRIASLFGGADRGSYFMPEVGDEAVLGYWRQDAALPIVLGFLWNGKDLPPETSVHKRTIKTKSGHLVVLDDTPGAEKIVIRSQGNPIVTLDAAADSITLTGGGRSIAMANGKVIIT